MTDKNTDFRGRNAKRIAVNLAEIRDRLGGMDTDIQRYILELITEVLEIITGNELDDQ